MFAVRAEVDAIEPAIVVPGGATACAVHAGFHRHTEVATYAAVQDVRVEVHAVSCAVFHAIGADALAFHAACQGVAGIVAGAAVAPVGLRAHADAPAIDLAGRAVALARQVRCIVDVLGRIAIRKILLVRSAACAQQETKT